MRQPIERNVKASSSLLDGCRRQSMLWINLRHWGLDARRSGGRMNSYVDKYEPALIFAVVVILICSVLDAHFTLQLMDRGAVELNYLMAYLMEDNDAIFIQMKVLLTALSVVLLVIHKNFQMIRGVRVGHFVHFMAASYMCLIGYELFLLKAVA